MTSPFADSARALLEAATSPGERQSAAQADLEECWPAIIGLCSQDPANRLALADLQAAVARFDDDYAWAQWIALMLSVLHEEPFVAIEPATGRGIHGRMSGISENFQLHTLLMAAFGRPVAPEAVATARGDGPQTYRGLVRGAWNLYTHHALRDGRLPAAQPADTEHWIWNEGVPAEIPKLNGARVILLGEPSYERSWNGVRTFAGLRASLDARELSADETQAWLAAIASSPRR